MTTNHRSTEGPPVYSCPLPFDVCAVAGCFLRGDCPQRPISGHCYRTTWRSESCCSHLGSNSLNSYFVGTLTSTSRRRQVRRECVRSTNLTILIPMGIIES